MVNGTNMLGKYNPRWPFGNAPETIKVPDPGLPAPRGSAHAQRQVAVLALGMGDARGRVRWTIGILAAWLTGLPRRAGRRLFAMNDLEAGWRGWQVTELAGGLGRQYRDHRFDGLAAAARPPVPPRPEAWDDHWDGRGRGTGAADPSGCPLDGDGR